MKAIRVKSDGFHSWTDDEIAQFEKRHPIGSRARLALALVLYTGQRRSSSAKMKNCCRHLRHKKIAGARGTTGREEFYAQGYYLTLSGGPVRRASPVGFVLDARVGGLGALR